MSYPSLSTLRIVDKHGSVSFAGTGYRVGNRDIGTTVGVLLSATPSRSRLTASCSGPIVLVMTRARSSEPRPKRTANLEEAMMVGLTIPSTLVSVLD